MASSLFAEFTSDFEYHPDHAVVPVVLFPGFLLYLRVLDLRTSCLSESAVRECSTSVSLADSGVLIGTVLFQVLDDGVDVERDVTLVQEGA